MAVHAVPQPSGAFPYKPAEPAPEHFSQSHKVREPSPSRKITSQVSRNFGSLLLARFTLQQQVLVCNPVSTYVTHINVYL